MSSQGLLAVVASCEVALSGELLVHHEAPRDPSRSLPELNISNLALTGDPAVRPRLSHKLAGHW